MPLLAKHISATDKRQGIFGPPWKLYWHEESKLRGYCCQKNDLSHAIRRDSGRSFAPHCHNTRSSLIAYGWLICHLADATSFQNAYLVPSHGGRKREMYIKEFKYNLERNAEYRSSQRTRTYTCVLRFCKDITTESLHQSVLVRAHHKDNKLYDKRILLLFECGTLLTLQHEKSIYEDQKDWQLSCVISLLYVWKLERRESEKRC